MEQRKLCSKKNVTTSFLLQNKAAEIFSKINIVPMLQLLQKKIILFEFIKSTYLQNIHLYMGLSNYGGKDETSSSKIVNTISDRLMRFKDRFKKVLIFNGGLRTSSEGNINIANCLGYIYELEGELTFYVINEAFRKDICQGISVQTAKDALIEYKMLDAKNGKESSRIRIDGRQTRPVIITFNAIHEQN